MPKPLLLGDATFDAQRMEDIESIHANWDNSYVPGYSEARQRNELLQRDGKKPVPIPRAQWVPIGNVKGGAIDRRAILPYARLGYQWTTTDDLESLGWGMPPTAYVAEDGTIRREDTALAHVSAERAAYNAAKQKRENEVFHATPTGEGPVETLEDESQSGKASLQDTLRKLNDLS